MTAYARPPLPGTVRPVDISPGDHVMVDGDWRTVKRVVRRRRLVSTVYEVWLRGGIMAGRRQMVEFGPAAEVKWRAGA